MLDDRQSSRWLHRTAFVLFLFAFTGASFWFLRFLHPILISPTPVLRGMVARIPLEVFLLMGFAVFPLHIACILLFNALPKGEQKEVRSKPFLGLPVWLKAFGLVVTLCALLRLAMFAELRSQEGGMPTSRNGIFLVENHGKAIRQLSEQEYGRQSSVVGGGILSLLMGFYLFQAIWFYRISNYKT